MGPFAGQPLASVTLDEIQRLVANSVPESLHLDYKRELKLEDRDEKKEFLRDLTALANAEGGLIVYGIDEDRDGAGKPTGMPRVVDGISMPNRDAFVLGVEHIIKDGIDERLPSYQLSTVPIAGDRCVLMIRVPPSLRAPHMVTLGGERRYFMRGNSGRQDMSTAQVRDAVLRTESVVERIRAFVAQRVAKFDGARTQNRPFWMMHVIPLVRTPLAFDVTDQNVIQRLRRIESPGGGSGTHTVEGYKVGYRDDDGLLNHTLVFREGTIEFLDQHCFSPRPDGVNFFACGVFDDRLFKYLRSAFELYREGLLQLPVVVAVTIQKIKGYRMPPAGWAFDRSLPIDEESITPDSLVVTELPNELATLMKPVLDYIWNAFGLPRCLGYNATGGYVGYR